MSKKHSGDAGFLSLLTLLFIGLKLTGYIGWSWLWVLSPLWIPLAIVAAFILSAIVFNVVTEWARK